MYIFLNYLLVQVTTVLEKGGNNNEYIYVGLIEIILHGNIKHIMDVHFLL